MCPHEAVVHLFYRIIKEFGGFARTMTSAILGVYTAAWQGFVGSWFSGRTNSSQGAEFLGFLAGHFEGLLPKRPGVTYDPVVDEVVVFTHFVQCVIIL